MMFASVLANDKKRKKIMKILSIKQQNKTDRLNNNWIISILMMTLAFSPFWMLILF